MSEIEKFHREHKDKSQFDLYVLSQSTHPNSVERCVVLAMLEERKQRRDWWTLVAAIVAALASVIGIL